MKTVQESLRHANSRITLDTYTQAVTPAKRQAQKKVVEMLRPSVPVCSHAQIIDPMSKEPFLDELWPFGGARF